MRPSRPWRVVGYLGLVALVSVARCEAAPPTAAECFPQAEPTDLARALVIGPAAPSGGLVAREYQSQPQRGRLRVAARGDGRVLVAELALRTGELASEAPYRELKYSSEQWYGSSFWTGPDWTRVGRNWHHPGESTPSVRCFRAPRDGRVSLSGRAYKLHTDGDGVRLMIRHRDREVWRAEIEGRDAQGVEPKLTLQVRQGDPIRFVVHKRGAIYCDTTGWDPVVTYEDGQTFRASEAFGEKQGAGNWSYELLTDDREEAGQPVLRSLSRGLALAGEPLPGGAATTLSEAASLPLLILSDGAGQSGLWLALDAGGSWTVECARVEEGLLLLRVLADAQQRAAPPSLLLGAFHGPWTAGAGPLAGLLQAGEAGAEMPRFRQAVQGALARVAAAAGPVPDLDLLLLAQAEWLREDGLGETGTAYREATLRQLERAEALLSCLPSPAVAGRLPALRRRVAEAGDGLPAWRELYVQTRLAKRELMLADPLLPPGPLLLCKRVPTSYSHLVMQYFGWRARPGGGLFVLDRPGRSLASRSLLGDLLPAGNVLEPRLSCDARRVVFSFVACPQTPYRPEALARNEQGPDEGYYHVYEVGVDGKGLRQLTSGPYDDLMPEYLPDGGIVFCSTRRRGNSRCFGAQFSDRWHSYTLHRIDGDGGNLRLLSHNDVSEWFPTIGNDGRLVYARWDYIDRDAVTHQNLWASRPDGTNPVALWGNAAPAPHCTFQAKAIPGSHKFVGIASAHHSITAGPVCLVDPGVDVGGPAGLTRITPGPLPEAEGWALPGYYSAPWPLSERLFLVAYSPDPLRTEGQEPNAANALGLYLLTAGGDRELLYRDPEIGCDNPTPLAPRPSPPRLPCTLPPRPASTGEFVLTDVYRGLGEVPRGSLKALRIIQVFPKTTTVANTPRLGVAGEENGRAILGTVPLQPDGSARLVAPAGKALLFQALDEDGCAYQTMRSLTYLQPGETVSCMGCHEPRQASPPNRRPQALGAPPSRIVAGELEGQPFSYARTVQPVLEARCVRCHSGPQPRGGVDLTGTPDREFTRSYWALCGDPAQFQGGDLSPARAQQALVPRFGQRNQLQVTPPGGLYGARGSRLLRMLREGHHGVVLTAGDLRRLAAWIDCNALFYGVYDAAAQAEQRAGRPVPMPALQ